MVFPVIGGDGKPTGYEIENSYRIDQGSAVGMARFGNNSRNGNTFTISFWIKRTKLGEFQTIVTSKVEDSGVNSFLMTFQSNDTIKVQGQPASGTGSGAGRDYIQTNAVFRDPSAWYHIVYRQDTTQSTSTDRHRIYVNGVQQSTSVYNPLDQNVGDAYFYNANSYPYAIGNDERDNDYGNFYIAEHHYTDGVSNGPDAFGETNDNGVWIPKEYTGSHGSYGHYLKFENASGGSGTTTVGEHDYTTGSSSTIGADSSGNDNHFHVQGYSAEDQTTDTPTNSFCTINSVFADSGNNLIMADFSEGNTKMLSTVDGWKFGRGTFLLEAGKWYVEVKATETGSGENGRFGIVPSEGGIVLGNTDDNDVFEGINVGLDSSNTNLQKLDTGSSSTIFSDFSSGSIAQLAFDLDNDKVWIGRNGTWYNNNNASTTLSPSNHDIALPSVDLGWVFGFGIPRNGSNNITFEYNWGNPSFAISSGNSDADGHGNYEYAVPSGFFAVNSKNLAEYG